MAENAEIGRFIEADPTGTFLTTPHYSWRLVDYGPRVGMVSEDPVLGAHLIKPGVLTELIRTPAFYRSYDLAQLSKLHCDGAIPNISKFSTAGGNLGQLPVVDFIADKLRAGDEERLAYQLAQSITDVSHGELRHVTDMEVEGLSGSQVFHESRKLETYELGGITDVLETHDIKIDANGLIPGIEIPPGIECESPHINADNFQYVLAEMYEWFAGYACHPDKETAELANRVLERILAFRDLSKMLEVDQDGHLIFKRPEDALFFQKCQMLASTEDWKEPINRVLLHLYIQDLKYGKVARQFSGMDDIDNGQTMHPHDYTYYIDSDVETMLREGAKYKDKYLYVSKNLKRHISQEERERFFNFKLRRYAQFLDDDDAVDYPNEMINGHVVEYGPLSSRVEILDKQELPPESITKNNAARLAPDELQSEEGVTYILDPLKNRVVRPFVRNSKGDRVYLDELDGKVGRISQQLYRQHQRLQWQQLTVRLVTTRDYANTLKNTFNEISERYAEALQATRMSADQKRRSIGIAALHARQVALENGLLVIKY